MGLREEIVFDSLGCPTPADLTTILSDNGSLYLSQYILLLHRRKEITKADIDEYIYKLKQFLNFGNLLRYPGDTSDTCPDNMIGIASACRLFYPSANRMIFSHGKYQKAQYVEDFESPDRRKLSKLIYWILKIVTFNNVRWVYNPKGPSTYYPAFTLSNWLGRQPGLIGYLSYCAGERVSAFQHLAIIVGCLITMYESKNPQGQWESSDRMLTYLMLEQLSYTYWVYKLLNNLFIKSINKRFGSVNGLVKTFFGENHSFSKYWF